MPVHNTDIANILNKVGDLLDIRGENPFRIRSYRNVARTVEGYSKNLKDMVENDQDLTQISGVGEDMAGKIKEIVETGCLQQLEDLLQQTPGELAELMQLENLGPKRIKTLHEKKGVTTLDDLEILAREHEIRDMSGFGEKTEQKILDEIERQKTGDSRGRTRLVIAEEYTRPLVEYLESIDGVKQVEVAGSYRRRKETVGDVDILVTCKRGTPVMDRFVEYEDIDRVVSKGKTKSTVIMRNEFQVDLRVVQQVSYGAALLYFTGSKAHNLAIRKLGQKRDLKINEYGVFKNDDRVAGKSEKEVYATVDLPFIPPEIREDSGEIEAAQNNKLPNLVSLGDIRGDLQSHTKATDGKFTMKEMVLAAKDRGYEYFAITDHSKRVTMAKGLDEKQLARQLQEMQKLDDEISGIRILKAVEVDILEDGSLDLDNDILKELDVVVCSVHYNTNLSEEKQTQRVLRAMDNPCFNIFAHPTERIIGKREPMAIDLEKIMNAAKERQCYLEVNAQPDRLDLSDKYIRMAKEIGVKLAISTDAHTIDDLDFMKYGVAQARRGWLEKEDVLNSYKWQQLKKLLKRD
jgi:DNA polymerase (family 10)